MQSISMNADAETRQSHTPNYVRTEGALLVLLPGAGNALIMTSMRVLSASQTYQRFRVFGTASLIQAII